MCKGLHPMGDKKLYANVNRRSVLIVGMSIIKGRIVK